MKKQLLLTTVFSLFSACMLADLPERDANGRTDREAPISIGRNGASFNLQQPDLITKSSLKTLNATGLTNITTISFNGGTSSFSDDGEIEFHNVRIESDTTTIDDYNVLSYRADPATLQLNLIDIATYPGVGVMYKTEGLFAKDVSDAAILVYEDDFEHGQYETHSYSDVDFSQSFKMTLESAQKIGFYITNLSGDLRYIVHSPSGEKLIDDILAGGFYWAYGFEAIEAGEYNIQFGPGDDAATVSFRLMSANVNINNGPLIEHDDSFSFTKRDNLGDYGVWPIDLIAGQTATFDCNGFGETEYFLIFEDNSLEARNTADDGDGLLIATATKTGRYYFFAVPNIFLSGTFYGSVTVKNELEMKTWAKINALPPQEDQPQDDPDGDSVPNLAEYALGMDPMEPSNNQLPALSKSGGNTVFTFRKPLYVVGVEYEMQESNEISFLSPTQVEEQLFDDGVEYDVFGYSIDPERERTFSRLLLRGEN